MTPDALFASSMAALQKGDTAGAIRFGDQLLEVSGRAGPAIVWSVRLRLEAQMWRQAIELGASAVDDNPGLSGLLGHAYDAIGDLEGARRSFAQAIREQPGVPVWRYFLASALSRLYRDFESMEVLESAVALSEAADPSALLTLAGYYLKFNYPEKAVVSVDRALAARPGLEGAQILAARAFMAMGRRDDAEARWHLAMADEAAPEAVEFPRAMSLARHAEFASGIEALTSILARKPRFVPALAQIAMSKRVSGDDLPLVEGMESILADPKLPLYDRIAVEYALGKAYDDQQRYGEAIAHFDEGNLLKYRAIEESGGFDRAGYAANMSLRRKVYAGEVVGALAREASASEVPIFVLGVIRSGTTLAEQILSSHPEVAGAGELDFWINADLRLMDYAAERLRVDELREAASTYLRLIGGFAKGGKTRVVDKQPGNLILAAALHIAFPNARIVYMDRNPLDTAISIWTTNVQTSVRFVNDKGNLVYASKQHGILVEHWREVIPSDRFMSVSYEALVDDRERTTRRMLEFCGLPWSDACLEPEKNDSQVITPSLWQVRQPVYRTSVARWKHYEPWLGEFRDLMSSEEPN